MSNFMNAMNKYRRARWCYTHGLKPMAKAYEMLIYLVRNSFIPTSCEVGGYYLRLQGNRPRHTQAGEGRPQLHNWATGDHRCQRGHDFGLTGQYSLGRCAG